MPSLSLWRKVDMTMQLKANSLTLLLRGSTVYLFLALSAAAGCFAEQITPPSRVSNGAFLVTVRTNGILAQLLIDTGATQSFLDDEFASRLGLTRKGTITIVKPYSMERADVVRLSDLAIGRFHLTQLDMMTSDLRHVSSALGENIDGVMGINLLCKFAIRLDYSTGTARFDTVTERQSAGTPIKLETINDLYFAPVLVQGKEMHLSLDTGSNSSSLSWSTWLSLTSAAHPKSFIQGVGSSGGSSGAALVCLPKVAIGDHHLRNLPIRLQPRTQAGLFADPRFDGLLGGDVLKQFIVTLDLAKQMIYLKKDPRYKRDPYYFSTIGIQFIKEPSGFFTVVAVWVDTPAAKAGIRIGDQILSVNGITTKQMDLASFSRCIHGAAGTLIRLKVNSNGQESAVPITVRNLLCNPKG
jgi:predicted aspartyl protease